MSNVIDFPGSNVIEFPGERVMQPLDANTSPNKYLQEVMQRLPCDELVAVTADIIAHEADGVVTQRVEELLRRADILREADSIIIKFSRRAELNT